MNKHSFLDLHHYGSLRPAPTIQKYLLHSNELLCWPEANRTALHVVCPPLRGRGEFRHMAAYHDYALKEPAAMAACYEDDSPPAFLSQYGVQTDGVR